MRGRIDLAVVFVGTVMGALFGVIAGVIQFGPWVRGFWLCVAALGILGAGLGAVAGRRNS